MQELQQEKAELTSVQGKVTYFHTPHERMCWHIFLGCVCVCVCVVMIIHLYTIWFHRHRQCSIRFFSSSADYLQRDSREAIHGLLDAMTWLVAEQLSYTVTHPLCNNGSWKTAKLPFVILICELYSVFILIVGHLLYTFLSLKMSAIWDPAIFTFLIFKSVLI